MKQLQKTIFPLILALILVLSTGMTVLATGEGNIDGGGGGMGSGTRTDVWHSQDGVRVTVVTTSGSVVSTPFDLTNSSIPNATINFGHVCKLQYTSGASLLVVGNIPLLYVLNRSWFETLMFSLPGKITLAICAAIVLFSFTRIMQLSKPIEYKA